MKILITEEEDVVDHLHSEFYRKIEVYTDNKIIFSYDDNTLLHAATLENLLTKIYNDGYSQGMYDESLKWVGME